MYETMGVNTWEHSVLSLSFTVNLKLFHNWKIYLQMDKEKINRHFTEDIHIANKVMKWYQFSSVQLFSCVYYLRCHELQHAMPPCPWPTPGAHPNSCPLSQWCHPTISSSVVPFSSCPQSFPASGSFPMSQFFASGGQSTGVSASTSVPPMNTQDWSPSGCTGWISLQSKGFSRVFSNAIVQKHQFLDF